MKASIGFIFFMLFLAGLAFVNLSNMNSQSDSTITAATELAETAWQSTHIGEMRLDENAGINIQFNSDNSVVGYSGCNRFSGDYYVTDGTFEIGPLAATRMACPEPANSFEMAFLQALGQARIVARVDSRLVMRDGEGITVARFVATEGNDSDD